MPFITVKFGDDEHALFNPNCAMINLVDNIRRRCRCETKIIIDLSDQDGIVQKLSEKSYQNANSVLKEREEYILIKVEKCSDAEETLIYTPLLNGLQRKNPTLFAKLQNISKPEEELPKQTSFPRKKSAWDRVASVRKLTTKTSNNNIGRPNDIGTREGKDEKGGNTIGEKKTAKQRRPVSIKM